MVGPAVAARCSARGGMAGAGAAAAAAEDEGGWTGLAEGVETDLFGPSAAAATAAAEVGLTDLVGVCCGDTVEPVPSDAA